MPNPHKTDINIKVIQWLNQKTESSNHQIVLLEGFHYMLLKLKLQGSVRVANGMFHQRFWKSLDTTLNYELYTKKGISELYQFYYHVSLSENLIIIDDDKANITEKGLVFLEQPYHEQLDFILSKIW